MDNTRNITISSPDRRTEVNVSEDTAIAQILKDQGINFAKASVLVDGSTLGNDSLSKSLKDLGAVNGSVISVCVKLQNA